MLLVSRYIFADLLYPGSCNDLVRDCVLHVVVLFEEARDFFALLDVRITLKSCYYRHEVVD